MLQKRFPEAMEAMEDVRRMGPDSALADVGMAQVYLAEGQYGRALPLMLKQPKAAVVLALLSSI
jgi:predicted Zn-dependent protease